MDRPFSPFSLLSYFRVDMRLRGGRGDYLDTITVHHIVRDTVGNWLSFFQHTNNRDFWVLTSTQRGDTLLTFLLDSSGIHRAGAVPTGTRFTTRQALVGLLKSSPSSTLFAVPDSVGARLFSFNRTTGVPTYRYTLRTPTVSTAAYTEYAFAAAFSPDDSRLYVGQWAARFGAPVPTTAPGIYQFDLTRPDSVAVQNSRSLIGTVPPLNGNDGGNVSDMQLGIDGKLYITAQDSALSVITCPNVLGTGCGLQANSIGLHGRYAGFNLPSLNQTLFVNSNRFQVQASDTLVCAGDTVTLAAYGGGADTFRWGVAASSAAPVPAPESSPRVVPPVGRTTYTVAGTGPCTSHTGRVTVQVRPRPAVALALTGLPPRLCVQSGLLALAGGSPAGGSYTGLGVSGGQFDPLVAGVGAATVTYTYTAPNGCAASARQTVFVDACLGVADAGAAPGSLWVWPNPATGTVTLRAAQAGTVQLLDAVGREVRATRAAAGQDVRWELAGLPPGLYVVRAGAATRRLVVAP